VTSAQRSARCAARHDLFPILSRPAHICYSPFLSTVFGDAEYAVLGVWYLSAAACYLPSPPRAYARVMLRRRRLFAMYSVSFCGGKRVRAWWR
jgi:hypothetical protein